MIDFAYFIAFLGFLPKMLYRMIRQYRYRQGWSQRMGHVHRLHPSKKCIWIHAVSLGEVNATRTLVGALEKLLADYEIVISTATDTGYARACGLYEKNHSVFYFPMDFGFSMRRAFENLEPDLILLMELEVWPNLARIAQKREVPVTVINGRISDRSFPRYKLVGWFTRWMFSKVTVFLVQSALYAQRFRELGVSNEKILVTNSLKYDTARITDSLPGADELARQIRREDDPFWVAGGTGPGEEKIIIDLFKMLRTEPGLERLRLAVIPRKPERFDEVASLIDKANLAFLRYSGIRGTKLVDEEKHPVILGDTMGDLNKFYAIASVVFVGRSLVPMGGSDMMEPAALGRCTIFGPHTENFAQTVHALLAENGAILVKGTNELYDVTRKCLTSPDFAQAIAQAGQRVIRQNQGATKKTLEIILSVLKRQIHSV